MALERIRFRGTAWLAILSLSACSGEAAIVDQAVPDPADAAIEDDAAGVPGDDAAAPPDDASAPPPDLGAAPDLVAAAVDAALFVYSWRDAHGCNFYEHYNGAACVGDNDARQVKENACWNGGQVNDLGVGRSCDPSDPAHGCGALKASCCTLDEMKYGAFCTLSCKADPNVCGPNAWCNPFGHICMPAACVPLITMFYPAHFPPPGGFVCGKPPLDGDVGKPCTKGGGQCLAAGSWCVGERMVQQSFCTHECAGDADCPVGSACVYDDNKPYFCVPKGCEGQFKGPVFVNGPPDPDATMCGG